MQVNLFFATHIVRVTLISGAIFFFKSRNSREFHVVRYYIQVVNHMNIFCFSEQTYLVTRVQSLTNHFTSASTYRFNQTKSTGVFTTDHLDALSSTMLYDFITWSLGRQEPLTYEKEHELCMDTTYRSKLHKHKLKPRMLRAFALHSIREL